MGILDEAIREHLELKRKQGAEQQELRRLEDDAFGPAVRPDAGTGESSAETAADDAKDESATTAPPVDSAGSAEAAHPDAEVEEAQREAIAQQPTEVFDVAGELAREQEGDEAIEADPGDRVDAEASPTAAPAAREGEPPLTIETPPPAPAPVDEEASGESEVNESSETRGDATVEAALPDADGAESDKVEDEPADAGDTAAFNEQFLSDELDRALDDPGDEPGDTGRTAFLEESDEFQTPQRPRRQALDSSETSEEDVLEETPDFLEEAPEHDRLWFEQKPPKDFDFND